MCLSDGIFPDIFHSCTDIARTTTLGIKGIYAKIDEIYFHQIIDNITAAVR